MRSLKWILYGLTLILFGAVAIAIDELLVGGGHSMFRTFGVICPFAGLIIATVGFLITSKK